VRIKDGATGSIAIDFRAAALNEGHLTIGVLPQVGSDPTDGSITIASSANPNALNAIAGSDPAGGAGTATESSRVASFFESFGAKLALLTRSIGAFFEP